MVFYLQIFSRSSFWGFLRFSFSALRIFFCPEDFWSLPWGSLCPEDLILRAERILGAVLCPEDFFDGFCVQERKKKSIFPISQVDLESSFGGSKWSPPPTVKSQLQHFSIHDQTDQNFFPQKSSGQRKKSFGQVRGPQGSRSFLLDDLRMDGGSFYCPEDGPHPQGRPEEVSTLTS